MRRRAALALLAPLLGACGGSIPGTAGGAPSTDAGEAGNDLTSLDAEAASTLPPDTSEAGTCAGFTYGARIVPMTDGDCVTMVLGKWQLCPDAPTFGITHPPAPYASVNAIEFLMQERQFIYDVLEPGDAGGLVRSQDPSQRGLVSAAIVEPGACNESHAPIADPTSALYGWTVERFAGPRTMTINGFPYVPVP